MLLGSIVELLIFELLALIELLIFELLARTFELLIFKLLALIVELLTVELRALQALIFKLQALLPVVMLLRGLGTLNPDEDVGLGLVGT